MGPKQPSMADVYLEHLQQERVQANQLQMALLAGMQEVARSTQSQAQVFAEYLKLAVTQAPPEVRVMTERDEAVQEEIRRVRSQFSGEQAQLHDQISPARFEELFGSLKQELG